MRNFFRFVNNILYALLNILLSSHIIFLFFQYSLNHVFFFMFDYFDLVRISESYAAFQNETKRRRIENRNAFNILSDDNINSFSSSSNSLHDFITTHFHNRTLQNVTFIVNNRFSSKRNRSRRVVDFKNKRSLSSRDK